MMKMEELLNQNSEVTDENLEKRIKTISDMTNCLNKYQEFYNLLQYCYQTNNEQQMALIIDHLNKIPKKILGRRCKLLYFKTYLLYYFLTNSWEKSIKYIYRINSMITDDSDKSLFPNLILGIIYRSNNLKKEACVILLNSYENKKIYKAASYNCKFILLITLLSCNINNPEIYIRESLEILPFIREGSFKIQITNIRNFIITYIKIKNICDEQIISKTLDEYIALLTTTQNFQIQNIEIIDFHLEIIEKIHEVGRTNEAIECLLHLINNTTNIQNRIVSYELLFKLYGEKIPNVLKQQFSTELYYFYKNECNSRRQNILSEIDIRESNEQLKNLLIELSCDSLTGCMSKNHFEKLIGEYLEANSGCSLIYFDIDNLKTANNAYGIDIGDEILKLLASCIRTSLNTNGLLCRYGNDEFILVIASMDKQYITNLVETIENKYYNSELFKNNNFECQFSYGIAIYHPDYYETPLKLIIKGEQLMEFQRERKQKHLTNY